VRLCVGDGAARCINRVGPSSNHRCTGKAVQGQHIKMSCVRMVVCWGFSSASVCAVYSILNKGIVARGTVNHVIFTELVEWFC
jgi:hypothetical protein